MLHLLKRHPIPIEAFFEDCLILTYAFPEETLRPLVPEGLELDTLRGHAFVAVAMVWTRDLRPAGWPRFLGRDFFLAGYRVFVRRRSEGVTRRGLRILRSDTDRGAMRFFGNLLTHYNYRLADVTAMKTPDRIDLDVRTPGGEADLRLAAELSDGAGLPETSIFADLHEARRYMGPLPLTFDYEQETQSIIVIKATRNSWSPRPVRVVIEKSNFVNRIGDGTQGLLSGAFHISDIPYRWNRGVREPLKEGAPC